MDKLTREQVAFIKKGIASASSTANTLLKWGPESAVYRGRMQALKDLLVIMAEKEDWWYD